MARLNEILVGRFARSLQKLFGQKGVVPTATLAPEIMPVHRIESGVENRYLEGWNRFALVSKLGGVAGNSNHLRFRNPVASNLIAVFEKIVLGNNFAGAQEFTVSQAAVGADLTTILTPQERLDARIGVSTLSALSISSLSGGLAGLAITIADINVGNLSQYDLILTINQELTLLPGDAIDLDSLTVNQGTIYSVVWRERFLEEAERT